MPNNAAVIIPARWGSTRFPGKSLHPIAGKPLVQHVWERCCQARSIEQVIIATDDMRIAEAAFDFGAEVAVTAGTHQSGTDRIAEVAKRLRGVSHIINVQGDEPLIDPALVTRLAKALFKDKSIGMITAANPFTAEEDVMNPNSVKVVVNSEGDALYFSRSQIPYVRGDGERPLFLRHQGIYGYQRKCLLQFVRWRPSMLEKAEQLEQLRALENGVRIRVIMTKTSSVGVDSPEDVPLVEARLRAGGGA